MKIIILLLAFCTCFADTNAQKKKTDSIVNKQIVLDKTKTPHRNITAAIPVFPDIIITSLNVVKEGAGYVAKYTFKNIGEAPVKKGWLYAQSYINTTVGAAGGRKTVSLVVEQEQLLNPGESINGSLPVNLNGLTIGNTYTYILCAMNARILDEGKPGAKWVSDNNQFKESDITNNQKRINFILQL